MLHAEVSKPDAAGTWFKDELEIIPKVDKKYDASVSGTVHELTIHDVSPDDQAEYTLEIGDESTTAVLKVEGSNVNLPRCFDIRCAVEPVDIIHYYGRPM